MVVVPIGALCPAGRSFPLMNIAANVPAKVARATPLHRSKQLKTRPDERATMNTWLNTASVRRCRASILAGATAASALFLAVIPSEAATPAPGSRVGVPDQLSAAAEVELARIARASGGQVGVEARHLESGLTLALNPDERFPMASTFKVAVAGTVLAQVESGRLSLDQLVPIDSDLIVPSDGLADAFRFPGVSVSIRNLIEGMITQSDNTATDVLVRLVGGPTAVFAWIRGIGVDGMRIDGGTAEIIRRFYQLPPGEPLQVQLARTLAAHPELNGADDRPNSKFDDEPQDTATPAGMVLLLTKIIDGHVLSPSSTDVLMSAMGRCKTGMKRLRGRLPEGVIVQDKTGTIGGSYNDVGIITLPEGRGRIIIAVYMKKDSSPDESREQAIADIGRLVYDYMQLEIGLRR